VEFSIILLDSSGKLHIRNKIPLDSLEYRKFSIIPSDSLKSENDFSELTIQ
jgi:hypothetical protein